MSYLIYKLLKLIRRIVEKQDEIDRQSRHRSAQATVMGNNSSVTSLAGVHGPSVGIAIGVSMGVLLSLAAYQYFKNQHINSPIMCFGPGVNLTAVHIRHEEFQEQFMIPFAFALSIWNAVAIAYFCCVRRR